MCKSKKSKFLAKFLKGFKFNIAIFVVAWFFSLLVRYFTNWECILANNNFYYLQNKAFVGELIPDHKEQNCIVILDNTFYPLSTSSFYNYPTLNSPLIFKYQKVINCLAFYESHYNQNSIGKEGEIGILQFKKSTWDYFCNKFNLDLDINNEEHQKILAELILEDNFWNIRHWSVWQKCYQNF